MRKGKRRRTIVIMDDSYARLVAEQERQSANYPSTPTIAMILDNLIQRHLPEPELKESTPKERVKKKFAKKARTGLMAEPAVA